jgi:hypothetical protein
VKECGDLQVGSWGSSWAVAHRRLGVGGWQGEGEGEGKIMARLPRSHPSLVSTGYRTKRIRGRESERWPAKSAT